MGSIFTNSARGSCKRLAIDTAPRKDTSIPGSSSEASSDAEYTDAPASEIMIFCTPKSGLAFIISATSLSVSREPVPLPILIKLTLNCLQIVIKVRNDLSHAFCGGCGKIVPVCNTLPVASTMAILTPVRIPGSRPIVTLAPAGAAISKSCKFLANTLIASASAFSRNALNSSVSI